MRRIENWLCQPLFAFQSTVSVGFRNLAAIGGRVAAHGEIRKFIVQAGIDPHRARYLLPSLHIKFGRFPRP